MSAVDTSWTEHAPPRAEGGAPDATITGRARKVISAAEVERALRALPALDIADGASSELVFAGLLGQGGMGVVRVARQRALEREVAVKCLRPEASGKPTAISALLAEARIQGALDHPNVVPVHALGRDAAGLPVLVMKRLAGVSWRALIRDPEHPAWPEGAGDRLTWHLDTLMQVSHAVHFAHSRGVVHRDIKPENVMAGAFGEIYLLDWGLACCPDPATVDPTVVGTPAYLAPEMLAGTGPHLGPWTDVYLLGAVLHEVLTGKARHAGETILDVLFDAADSTPVDYPPSVPAELASLCNRATSKDPVARPPSALAFRREIAEYLQHRGAIALAEAAAARLAELHERIREGPSAPRGEGGLDLQIRASFSEASFGFRQALRAWSGNAAARRGLDEALAAMIGYELSRRNPEAAAALLAEHSAAPAELTARLLALQAELTREREELTQLRGLARGLDPVVGFRPRFGVILGVGALGAGGVFGLGKLRPEGPSQNEMILLLSTGTLLLLGTVLARRRTLLSTQLNQKSAASMVIILIGTVLNHVVGALMGVGVAGSVPGDLLIGAMITGLLAVGVARGIVTASLILVTFALLAAAWPRHALPLSAAAFFLSTWVGVLHGWYVLGAMERSSR